MKFAKITVLALAIAAMSAHATGVNQNGNSNANSQTTQPTAPPVAPSAGPVYNNGVGIGITSGNVTNTVSTAATGIGGAGGTAAQKQGQKQKQAQAQKQRATATNANVQAVTIEGDAAAAAPRIPVATAYAAGLTATGPCLGSASGGIQAAAVGISLGGTKQDEGCNRRYNAQVLDSMGMTDAAIMLLCQDDAIREAMTATGRSCAQGGAKVRPAPAPALPVLYHAPAGNPAPAAQFTPERAPREDRGALSQGGDIVATR